MSIPAPRDIRLSRRRGEFEFEWSPDDISILAFRTVRLACRCAFCVDEKTGEPLLDPQSVPEDVSVTNVELVGNYALRIHWTDGHATGLYTWTHLRELDVSKGNA